MIARTRASEQIQLALSRASICYLAGPRQSGKTTLARTFLASDDSAYFDLEDPETDSRLSAPKLALNQACPLTVIDEVQKRPELFPLLRVLVDAPDRRTKYLILGSASPRVLKGVSESLAGRVEQVELGGFTPSEVGGSDIEKLRLRGGLPPSFLAASDADSLAWRKSFLNVLAEKDIPMLGTGLPPAVLLRLLAMVAHYHGQVWNSAEPARSLGISDGSVRNLVDFFEGLFLVRVLRPWHENLGKRQVKSPKLYFRDSGLLNALLGIRTSGDLYAHPKSGASWEGFAIEQLLGRVDHDEAYFWATHNGAELDLMIIRSGARYGFEFKLTSSPRITASMRIALADLRLERLWVVHPGERSWRLDEGIEALSLDELLAWTAIP
jgi:predicted AAA+ superfamily ATPase